MCGILGVVAVMGAQPSVDDTELIRLRDLMIHRGPDGAGIWRRENVALAHRRLAVIDRTPAGAQPTISDDGRIAMVYNGELYNDADLRRAILRADPRPFRTSCDTETVRRAIELWGEGAVARFRGMFALAWWDGRSRRMTLARDPLGVKPLFWMVRAREIIFASEPNAILAHHDVSPAPNLAMISAYLTTIRTAIGVETLFADLFSVEPGSMLRCDMTGDAPRLEVVRYWSPGAGGTEAPEIEEIRAQVESSIEAHLRSDAPVCALLSGGLDSAITTTVAARNIDQLRTYCAGALTDANDDDLACAQRIAREIGVRHDRAILTRRSFAERWPAMVRELGVPLSTPNEVAIYAVASRLRADGCVVTISGEGADELFAGYDMPMVSAWRFSRTNGAAALGGAFQLESNAWVPPRSKGVLLRPEIWSAVEEDTPLHLLYGEIFAECVIEAGERADPAEAHVRFLRRVNLTGLLGRLDSSTMLAGVEGRTPFADAKLAELAASLPMRLKFDPGNPVYDPVSNDSSNGGGGVATVGVARMVQTKIALRRAFAGRISDEAAQRPKASFPLPFQEWVADQSEALRRSSFARAIFSTDSIETIASAPSLHWRFAWPMMNIACWGDRWWGDDGAFA